MKIGCAKFSLYIIIHKLMWVLLENEEKKEEEEEEEREREREKKCIEKWFIWDSTIFFPPNP